MDFEMVGPTVDTWEKVTRKIVDPITFACSVNVTFVPRIEDCAHETTCEAFCNPRLYHSTLSRPTGLAEEDNTWTQMDFATGTPVQNSRKKAGAKGQKPGKLPLGDSPTKSKSPKKSASSLGAFFQKDTTKKIEEMDTQSVSSRSMNSRSVADISFSERSQSEMEMSKRVKKRRDSLTKPGDGKSKSDKGSKSGKSDDISTAMMSIDESSVADFSVDNRDSTKEKKKPKGKLGNFLQGNAVEEESDWQVVDSKSVASASTLGSKSIISKAEKKLKDKEKSKGDGKLSSFLKGAATPPPALKNEDAVEEKSLTMEEVGGPIVKKLRFKDGHDEKEIPWPTDSMYDDLFYTSEELADFRYEAFLEEAGLDVNEFM